MEYIKETQTPLKHFRPIAVNFKGVTPEFLTFQQEKDGYLYEFFISTADFAQLPPAETGIYDAPRFRDAEDNYGITIRGKFLYLHAESNIDIPISSARIYRIDDMRIIADYQRVRSTEFDTVEYNLRDDQT